MSIQLNITLPKTNSIVNHQELQNRSSPSAAGYQPLPQQPDSPNSQLPIVKQPGKDGWMNTPIGVPTCPPGLEYLSTVDQLIVKQKIELAEAITGFETNNKYTIKNSLGQKVYWAIEDSNCCTRNLLCSCRPFEMKIFDIYKNEVINIDRPLACDCWLCGCCLQTMDITSPAGVLFGCIEQEFTFCYPQYRIKNHLGDIVLKLEGPFCTYSCGSDVEFKIVSLNGQQIGKISKEWAGLEQEYFTDADNFGISFPLDLDVQIKAVLLGATFLIDAMFFESSRSTRI